MPDQRKGLRTGELMERICDILEVYNELSYREITEIKEFDNIPDWKLELAIKKLLYSGDIVETDSNNYQLKT